MRRLQTNTLAMAENQDAFAELRLIARNTMLGERESMRAIARIAVNIH